MSNGTLTFAKYTILPGIVPRLQELFFSGFAHLTVLTAYIYASLNLLPRDHPYLKPENFGRFRMRHVLFEARRQLVFKWQHADQVIIYFTLLIGFVLLIVQFVLLFAAFFMQEALASSFDGSYASFFVTREPEEDLAFILLDRVFGFEGVYGSNALDGTNPFHTALHTLFHFYNVGILVVGLIIFLYFVVTVVAETAQSGTPFGRRFNGAWVPLRLVFAIGLLTPLMFGMNGAQWITLYAAKWGSSMATNGWIHFLDNLQESTPMGPTEELMIRPRQPTLSTLQEFMFVAMACTHAEKLINNRTVNGYLVSDSTGLQEGGERAPRYWLAYEYGGDAHLLAYYQALRRTNFQDIRIAFGYEPEENGDNIGRIEPICGELTMSMHTGEADSNSPAYWMQNEYFRVIGQIWLHKDMQETARNVAIRYLPTPERDPSVPVPSGCGWHMRVGDGCEQPNPDCNNMTEFVQNVRQDLYALIDQGHCIGDDPDSGITADENPENQGIIDRARQRGVDHDDFWNEEFRRYGWAGAAIWYNKLAEINGSFMSSVHSLPIVLQYPKVMEHVSEQRRAANASVMPNERFRPYLPENRMVYFDNPVDPYIAMMLYEAQQYWDDSYIEIQHNAFLDTIVTIFGLSGLFDMRQNTDVHPLAQIVGIGRGLIESSIQNLGFSFGAGVAGGLAHVLGAQQVKTVAMGAAGFAWMIALLGLSIGFILFYVIPFLPFLYFFFAAGGWIKAIFEAMIGLPLWALAHIRIDQEGLPGPVAMNGYYLILDIFLRPLLMIFGLLASIVIFAAQVTVLHEIWDLVVDNLVGYNFEGALNTGENLGTTTGGGLGAAENIRGWVDQFFFTILYAIIVYMIGMASFKLVDLIPNHITRWMGSGLSTFGEHLKDPASQLVSQVFMGSRMMIDQRLGNLPGLMGRNS